MKTLKLLFAIFALCISFSLGTFALAAPGKVICTAAEAIGCAQDKECIRGSADKLSLPMLWKLNFTEKTYLSLMANGTENSGGIIEIIKVGDALYLLGSSTSDDRVWSAYIDTTDWKMTLTAANFDAGYIIHGFCNSKILEE